MKKVVVAVWCVVLLSCVIVAVVVLRRDCSCDSEKAGVVESAKTTKAEELKQPAPVSEDPALIPNDALPLIAEKTVPKVLPSKPSRHIRIPVELSAVPQTMLRVAGEQDGNNYFARSKAMRTLGKKLLIEEVSLLYILMNRRASDDPLPADQLNALKNEAADLLLEQKIIPSDLANNLMAMYSNKKHDVVWRDYCIQHLGSICGELANGLEKNAVIQTMWEAADETKTSIAGTALISLTRNSGDGGIRKERIAKKALGFVEDANCGESARITALQICAKLGEKSMLPTAREITNGKDSVPLRMSAIAAIGTLGDESDLPILEKNASNSDIRLRTAAKAALKRLR